MSSCVHLADSQLVMWNLITNYWVGSLATAITLLPISTFLYRMAYIHKAMKFFFIYLVAKLLIEVVMFYLASKGVHNLFLGNTLTVVGFYLMAKMFYETYESKEKRFAVIVCCVLFSLIVGIDLYRDGIEYTFKYVGLAQCILTMLFCLLYFHELIRRPKIPNLLSYPFFWLCASMLIYFAPCIVLSPMQYYLDQYPMNTTMYVFTLLPYILEILYLTGVSMGILAGE